MAVEGYSNTDWIASGHVLEGTHNPTQLFTAEDDIKTSAAPYAAGAVLAVLTILARDGDGNLTKWAPDLTQAVVGGAEDQTERAPEAVPVGVSAADMNTSNANGGTNADTYGPYYVSACFNPDLLVWPASLASVSYEQKQAALETGGAPFRIKRLL